VSIPLTRFFTFAVIEGYSSTKTFVHGSQHNTHDSEMNLNAVDKNRVFRGVLPVGNTMHDIAT
jgi:hypothetical protein